MKGSQGRFLSSLTLSMLCAVEKWQAVYTILEAFGNASTCMNGNASRFSHVVSLDFDQTGMVTSASIQVNTRLFCINAIGARLPKPYVRLIMFFKAHYYTHFQIVFF